MLELPRCFFRSLVLSRSAQARLLGGPWQFVVVFLDIIMYTYTESPILLDVFSQSKLLNAF